MTLKAFIKKWELCKSDLSNCGDSFVLHLNDSASERGIGELENALQRRLPSDLKALLSGSDGFHFGFYSPISPSQRDIQSVLGTSAILASTRWLQDAMGGSPGALSPCVALGTATDGRMIVLAGFQSNGRAQGNPKVVLIDESEPQDYKNGIVLADSVDEFLGSALRSCVVCQTPRYWDQMSWSQSQIS